MKISGIAIRKNKKKCKNNEKAVKIYNNYIQIEIQQILGLTISGNQQFCVHPTLPLIAYVTGCIITIYDWKEDNQIKHLLSSDEYTKSEIIEEKQGKKNKVKTISCCNFSIEGKYLIVGEVSYVFIYLVRKVTQGYSMGLEERRVICRIIKS